MRAVLDPNVIISALLSPAPSPAKLLRAWQQGEFELIVSPILLGELATALAYPKLRKRITCEEARRLVEWLAAGAVTAGDPGEQPPIQSPDPDDDYLIAVAHGERALLVSGDKHLLGLAGDVPVVSPAEFLVLLER